MEMQFDPEGPLAHLALLSRECYEQDHLKIVTSKSFYRQGLNRQVFRLTNPYEHRPAGRDYVFMSRFNHSSIVGQVANRLADELGLNHQVCRASGYGHDLGQPPKGHFGGEWISKKAGQKFLHEHFTLVLLEQLENIQLSLEAQQCIAFHGTLDEVMARPDLPEECRVVALADKLAYVIFDVYETIDVLRKNISILPYSPRETRELLSELEEILSKLYPLYLPVDYLLVGSSRAISARWAALHYVEDLVIEECRSLGQVSFSQSVSAGRFLSLRDLLYRKVYKRVEDLLREDETQEIDEVFKYIVEKHSEYDPLLILLLFDEIELREMSKFIRTGEDKLGLRPSIEEIVYLYNVPKISERQIDIFARPPWA